MCAECKSTSTSVSGLANESFRETLDKVHKQIEIDCYRKEDVPQVKEIALIITSILRLNDTATVYVGGENHIARDVKDVFSFIEGKHIDLILNKLKQKSGIIQSPRAYLITLLYNSVFEFETATEEMNKDWD